MDQFKNKIAFITGAGSGIGRALAKAMAAHGTMVYASDIAANLVENLQSELKDGIMPVKLDVCDGEQFQREIAAVFREHGRLDYLFNNAGIGVAGDAHRITSNYWNRIIDVNIRGMVNGITAAYPLMVGQRAGHIINTASLGGLVPIGLLTPYAMTKHAVIGLTTSLRVEAAAHGVKVSAICPAAVETALLDPQKPHDLGADFWLPNVRRYLTALAGKPYPSDKLAEDALRGIRRNKALIVIPARARLVWRLSRLVPGLVEKISIAAIARERVAG